MKEKMERAGRLMSGMVMPNIGAFMAWGLLSALFIEGGWLPNPGLASVQAYLLTYLLPILLAAQGGMLTGGERGRLAGAIAVIGCIAGAGAIEDSAMLLGAMVIGPLSGGLMRSFDRLMSRRVPAGFEMLVANLSVGVLGVCCLGAGYFCTGLLLPGLQAALSYCVGQVMLRGVVPLSAVFIEPAKVLFLNNALNHGIFTPIGTEQVHQTGVSIMYLLETNPGPGLGVLLAFWAASESPSARSLIPGAAIIQFFGGIHEIYFPYVLTNPILILAPMAGNACAIAFYALLDCGLVGPASPGSIIALLTMSPKAQIPLTLAGVLLAAMVSFGVGVVILRTAAPGTQTAAETALPELDWGLIRRIVFVCDAGMGTSAMGAASFARRVTPLRPELRVENSSVSDVPEDAELIICQQSMAEQVKRVAPSAAMLTIRSFLADPVLDRLYQALCGTEEEAECSNPPLLMPEGIRVGLPSVTGEEAVCAAGELLVQLGCVTRPYVASMLEREALLPTAIGMEVAIPHGTDSGRTYIQRPGVVLLQYPDGVDLGGERVRLVFGIAAGGEEHLALLERICTLLEDKAVLSALKKAKTAEAVLALLS